METAIVYSVGTWPSSATQRSAEANQGAESAVCSRGFTVFTVGVITPVISSYEVP